MERKKIVFIFQQNNSCTRDIQRNRTLGRTVGLRLFSRCLVEEPKTKHDTKDASDFVVDRRFAHRSSFDERKEFFFIEKLTGGHFKVEAVVSGGEGAV